MPKLRESVGHRYPRATKWAAVRNGQARLLFTGRERWMACPAESALCLDSLGRKG